MFKKLIFTLTSSFLLLPSAFADSLDVRIISADDDAEEKVTNGVITLDSTGLELINDDGGNGEQAVGLRFQNITIPQGEVIRSAFIEFTASQVATDTTSLTIYGEDIDDSPTFTTTPTNVSGRTITTASVAWNSIPSWDTGNKYQSADLTPIIQEIVDRTGWTSGNAMTFLFSGLGKRAAYAKDHGSPTASPRLVIEYGPDNEIDLQAKVEDPSGALLDVDVQILDATDQTLIDSQRTNAQLPMTKKVTKGTYDVKVTMEEGDNPIKEIIFDDINLQSDISEVIKIDKDPASITGQFAESFAINPETSDIPFAQANVKVNATGKSLFKCQDWDFVTETCTGRWKKLKNITPGQEYDITITPGDPGFGEGDNNIDMLDKDDYLHDYTETVTNTDGDLVDLEITPTTGPIDKIEVRDHDTTAVNNELKIENTTNETDFAQTYSIDPTNLAFNDATVHVQATGRDLFKCTDWDFALQICNGRWKKLKDVQPGQSYDFILTAADPGFGEGDNNVNLLDKDDYLHDYTEVVTNTTGDLVDLEITPTTGPIDKIEIRDHDITSINNDLKVETAINNIGTDQGYAFDPTTLAFNDATVHVQADGKDLFKCTDWDFTNKICNGRWKRLQDITPGMDYNFILTAADPGFWERKNRLNLLDDDDYLIDSDEVELDDGDPNDDEVEVEITPQNETHTKIKKIKVKRHNKNSANNDIRIKKDVDNTKVRKSKHIKADRLNYNQIVVTEQAEGKDLFKCKDWDDGFSKCNRWKKLKNLVTGANYEYIIDQTTSGPKIYSESKDGIVLLNDDYEMLNYNQTINDTVPDTADIEITMQEVRPIDLTIHDYIKSTVSNEAVLNAIAVNAPVDGEMLVFKMSDLQATKANIRARSRTMGRNLFMCSAFNHTTKNCTGRWKRKKNFLPDTDYNFDILKSELPDGGGWLETDKQIAVVDKDDYLEEFTETTSNDTGTHVDVDITPVGHKLKKIRLRRKLKNSANNTFKVEKATNETQFAESYSIDPTGTDFDDATIEATATGNRLYKCQNWDFTTQVCLGEWKKMATSLTPGQDYSFILTPDDPGFGEGGDEPEASINQLERFYEGGRSIVRIDYTLTDPNDTSGNFTTETSQVQYSTSEDGPWTDVSLIYGKTADALASVGGEFHTKGAEALYWDTTGIPDGNYYLRIRPHDGTQMAIVYGKSSTPVTLYTPSAGDMMRHGKTFLEEVKQNFYRKQ